MSSAGEQSNFPTMIIPKGTEIRLNNIGQLSIKTPGNLVIQNSGTYSELESTNGSIRIEENVSVEAVSVKAGQACFIQGTLTAWRVHAKRIALEDRAKAYIMLQESEQLELSKTSRLVGNFANEKEIFLMLGKFTSQLKELPGSMDVHAVSSLADQTQPRGMVSPLSNDHLDRALVLLEGEIRRGELEGPAMEALREVVFSLRERNVQRTALIYRDAFSEVKNPSENLRQAAQLLDLHFAKS